MKTFVPTSVSKTSRQEDTWTLVPKANQPLPAGLNGHVFVVAPLPPPEDQPKRGERAFPNGDGLIYRLSFENGTAKLTTAIAKTPCYYADLATQYDKHYKSLAFRDGGVVRMSLALGSRNQLNTAFLKMNRRLLITYDAGRPYTLDPQTLEVVEPIGATKDWIIILGGLLPISNIFQPYSGSAHPVCVPPKQPNSGQQPDEGFIVNYSSGYNGKFKVPVNRVLNRFFGGMNRLKLERKRLLEHDEKMDSNEYWGRFTDLIRYKSVADADQTQPEYEVERWRLQLPNGQPVVIKQSVHQMGITEKFIILGDLQFGLEYSQIFSPYILSFIWSRGFNRLSHWIKNPLGEWLYSVFLQLLESAPFTDFYLIRRDQLDDPKYPSCQANQPPQPLVATKISLPRTVSHFAVDYADSEKLIFHVGHHNGLDPTEWINQFDQPVTRQPGKDYLRKDLQGFLVGTTDLGSFARYEFDPETGALLKSESVSDAGLDESEPNSSLPTGANTWLPSVYTHRNLLDQADSNTVQHIYWTSWGFSWELIPQRIYDAYRDREYREIPLEQLPDHDVPPTLLCLDTTSMTIADAYAFPEGHAAYSPQFIPSTVESQGTPASRHGFIVCVVLSDHPDDPEQPQDEFWIFDASCLHQGPICKLHHPAQPLNLGATLHSTWLSADEFATYRYSEQERLHRREQSVKQDYQEAVVIAESRGKQRIKDLFETIIYPHFVAQTSEAKLIAHLKHSTQSASADVAPADDSSAYSAIPPNGSTPAISENGLVSSTTDAAATADQ
ncbi:hypothetical protein HJG54_23070 [Leptolyngbya sp. NK1-12]|uniref:Lignostilbene-alpha,beta-dioxygenase n=1 Tax=Leptolyngbya sp. NK1-12 TaxID=2547451 RepID=A0AA96WNW6_9CYAN|nr:hypothetical protein HJG54_23070 [Leptolyngbya sp. NK1-12]